MARIEPNPSLRYQSLMRIYARLHLDGDPVNKLPAEKVFDGRNLDPHIEVVRQLCRRFQAKSALDYGSGKALAYEGTKVKTEDGREIQGLQAFWGLQSMSLYDPALAQFADLPEGTFDAVLATNVLEYTPPEDIDWVLSEIVAYARRFVFITIACYASPWNLPGGGNYHATVASAGWWTDRLLTAHVENGPRIFALLFDNPNHRVMAEI
ncbi:MAG TPA: class I SAM-dependent methyltransferase [Kiloniellales bacterium]|nr:class I SAM-dependent methyltransferase [Kiloniellales bacterium]